MRTGFLLALAMAGCGAASAQTMQGWKLVWSDEFNGAANTAPDATKWTYDLGGGGWGNNEAETYTNSTQNAYQDGQGHLVIQALNNNGAYTSARIKTEGLYSFTYGKAIARIKIPFGQGIWPAFWMLGSDITTVSWPQCGEIDIMENFGKQNNDASTNHGTLHGPGYEGVGLTGSYTLPNGQTLSSDFHLFEMEWAPGSVKLSVDGNVYSTVTSANVPSGGSWVFDNNPMFFILNVAVGGTPAPVGYPDGTTAWPQQMLVDYVRVYQQEAITPATPNIAPGGVANAASGSTSAIAPGSLAAIYGINLADETYSSLFDTSTGAFATSTSSGVSLSVNGVSAPLIYVSPGQINFQVPWETEASPVSTLDVVVNRSGAMSEAEPFTFSGTSPSVFLNYNANNAALLFCQGGAVAAGAACTIYGNGFGPKNAAAADGVPASANPPDITALEVPGQPQSCQLTVGGVSATVLYCGAAPGEVIDQLNFTYPANAALDNGLVDATLTIGGFAGSFTLPPPSM